MSRGGAKWWILDESCSPHEKLVPLVKQLFDEQHGRYEAYRKLLEAYGADMTARGGTHTEFQKAFDESLSMNELTNTIETLHSQVFKNRILPAAVSTGGNYGTQSRAKALGRWLDGVFDEVGLHTNIAPKAGLHALIVGTGFFRVGHKVVDTKKRLAKITIDVADAMDVAVDPMDAMDGEPMAIFQVSKADRGSLIEKMSVKDSSLYGTPEEREEAIEHGESYEDSGICVNETDVSILNSDKVVLYEAFRRPTAAGKKGMYFLCTSTSCLIAREYEFQEFPHVPIRWMLSPTGFYGQSAVARLVPGQRTYDKMCVRGDVAHDIMGVPRLILRRGSGFDKAHIDDVEGSIFECDDPNGLKEWNPTPIHPDFYRERDSLPAKMRGLLGVSEYSTNATLPQQLREASGVALENWVDQESSKHSMAHRSLEDAICQLAYRIIDEANYLQEQGYDVQSKSINRNTLDVISFKDVSMDREEFRLRVMPVSHLSRTFTGKTSQLKPLKDDGTIRMSTYRRLLEVPDIESENDLDTATDEMCDKMLNKVLEKGEVFEILAYDDVDLIVERGGKFINYLRLHDVESKKMAPVIQYVNDAFAMQQQRKEAQMQEQQAMMMASQPPPPPPAGPPPGAGAPPPMDVGMPMGPPMAA